MTKYFALFILAVFTSTLSISAQSDSTTRFIIDDSIRATQFMATIQVKSITTKKESLAGIRADGIELALESDGKKRELVFNFPGSARVLSYGIHVKTDEAGELEWDYDWSLNENYKLLLSVASDSAENFILYSGYAWLPKENKWKLIGTCRIDGRWGTIKAPSVFYSSKNRKHLGMVHIQTGEVWLQRSNNSWKNLHGDAKTNPTVNVASHIDSLEQHQKEIEFIKQAIASGKTDAKEVKEVVFYTIMKEGTGRQVLLTDTVVVHYKGYLLSDGIIFDQTKTQPATFPLNRLIRGWQIGVPLCKVGGKIKIVIPSALAYSIRTRSPKIPPNSILVFEVEVLEVKPR